jgi:hypothetical protein
MIDLDVDVCVHQGLDNEVRQKAHGKQESDH